MDPTFDDLIPAPQADALNFDDLIPWPYAPPGGEVDFEDLIPNPGAPWSPSALNAGAGYPARTIGNPIAGHELQQSQPAWGGPVSFNGLANGAVRGQYNFNAAFDNYSGQKDYRAFDSGDPPYPSNPDGRPAIADGYVLGRDLSPKSDVSGSPIPGGSSPSGPASRSQAAPMVAAGPSIPRRPRVTFDPPEALVPADDPPRNYKAGARPIPASGAGVPSELNLPFNVRPVPDLDWSLGPIGVVQASTFPVELVAGAAGSAATETLHPQKSVGVFTLLTANQQLRDDGVKTSDRYNSDGALVRDFLDAKTGEIIGSASPYNGSGLQQLSDGLTFVRYDAGGTLGLAPGVTKAEFAATDLYNRSANDWWLEWKRNGQQPFASGAGFNKLSRLHAYNMLNAISSDLGNRYVDSGMFNLNSIAMIGGLLRTNDWSASAARFALAAPQEGPGAGYRFSGGVGYEPIGPSGLNRYGGFLPAEAMSHLTLPSQLPADFDTNLPIGRFAWLLYAKPGNTLGGEYAHVWIGNLFRRAAPTDAISELNTAPGSRGVDINVDPDRVSDVGFRHGEIKPNSAYGIRSYNDQVKNWGLTDPVQAISYDKDGDIYLGFPKVK